MKEGVNHWIYIWKKCIYVMIIHTDTDTHTQIGKSGAKQKSSMYKYLYIYLSTHKYT